MIVYRLAKTEQRALDLSGTGAFRVGGRWNNVGVFALYTSEHPSLAMLEILVHVEESELPPDLYLVTIDINDSGAIYEVKETELPADWRVPDNIALKMAGDKMLLEKKYLAFKVRSAVMPEEYNIIINPIHPDFNRYVRVQDIGILSIDKRL